MMNSNTIFIFIIIIIFSIFLFTGIQADDPPVVLSLSHSNALASNFKILDDDLVNVDLVTKYQKKATRAGVKLTGSAVTVTCEISVGNQPFVVLLDTGSPLLAIPTPGCACDTDAPNKPYAGATAVPCSDTGCKRCCASGICDSSLCSFDVVYADGTSLNGSLYQDSITMGSLTARMKFGGITQETPRFVAPYADGILGFSQDGSLSCNPSCIPPIFSVFVNNRLVANSFGIYLNNEGSGELTLGGADMSAVDSPFVYTPLLSNENHYSVEINSFEIGGTKVLGSIDAILDTGTTYIMLPVPEYNQFVDYLQKNYCDLVGVCSTFNIFTGNCLRSQSNVDKFPTLVIRLNGVDVQVPPSTYFLPTTLQGQQAYCFGFGQWNEDFTILGYTFMRGLYILYDMQNSRIGIAGTNATANASSAALHSSSIVLSVFLLLFVFLQVMLI